MGSVMHVDERDYVPTAAPPPRKKRATVPASAAVAASPAAPAPAGGRRKSWLRFDEFYEENKAKIMMADSQTYPINQAALREWRGLMIKSGRMLSDFALVMTGTLRHVSFWEFYETLIRAAYEVFAHSISLGMPIVLVVGDAVLKSNLWTALLVWPILAENVDEVQADIGVRRNVLYVIVDDASYSGDQLIYGLNVSGIDERVTHLAVLLGAISETARRLLLDRYSSAIIPNATIRFDTIFANATKILGVWEKDPFEYDWNSQPEKHEWLQATGYNHAIYFDHKLADNVSTVTKLIAVAPHFDERSNVLTFRPLIRGCTLDTYKIGGMRIADLDRFVHVNKFDEAGGTCPPTFYKTIHYTFRGAKVTRTKTFLE